MVPAGQGRRRRRRDRRGASKPASFDYDAPIEGLAALDRYTLRIKLNEPDYILFGYLRSSPMAAVAREVVERYGDANGWAMEHPVGTGPFMLKSWRRGQQIVLEANPNFRDERFPEATDAADRARRRADAGQEAAARRSRRDLDHRGVAIRGCSRSTAAQLDYVNLPPELVRPARSTRRTRLQARVRGARRHAASG